MNKALGAIAKVAKIDVQTAIRTVRRHPLFNEEISLEEELINLEEAFEACRAAGDTLKRYPKIRRHMFYERHRILRHCVGQIARMMRGRDMHREYSQVDTTAALRKMVRIIVDDAKQSGWRLNDETVEALKPFMSPWQRLSYSERAFSLFRMVRPVAYRRSIAKS